MTHAHGDERMIGTATGHTGRTGRTGQERARTGARSVRAAFDAFGEAVVAASEVIPRIAQGGRHDASRRRDI